MGTLGSLTLYGARRSVSGFDQLIRPDARNFVATRDFDGQDEDGRAWGARLYLWGGIPKQPDWAGFVRDGFGYDIEIPDRTSRLKSGHRQSVVYATAGCVAMPRCWNRVCISTRMRS